VPIDTHGESSAIWWPSRGEIALYVLAFLAAVWGTLSRLHVAWFSNGDFGLLQGDPSRLDPRNLALLEGSLPLAAALLAVCFLLYSAIRMVRVGLNRTARRQDSPEEIAFWSEDGPESAEQAFRPDKTRP